MNTFTHLSDERVASIREIQKNPSQALRGITRILRGSKTIGFFLANEDFADLVESNEALSSPAYLKRMASARRAFKAGKGKSLDAAAKSYGV